jgi:hypothetical protein
LEIQTYDDLQYNLKNFEKIREIPSAEVGNVFSYFSHPKMPDLGAAAEGTPLGKNGAGVGLGR